MSGSVNNITDVVKLEPTNGGVYNINVEINNVTSVHYRLKKVL
jgi:hypothetical protein